MTLVAVGIGLLVLGAVALAVLDAASASTWRHVAAERRRRWEQRGG